MSIPLGPQGEIDGLITVVGDFPPGDYVLGLTCFAGDTGFPQSPEGPFEVLAGPPTAPAIEMSYTPTEGSPGSVIEVAAACRLTADRPGDTLGYLFSGIADDGSDTDPLRGEIRIGADGTGHAAIRVPESWPSGDFTLNTGCHKQQGAGLQHWGQIVGEFRVDADIDPPPPRRPPPPARPVTATPTYTG